jgi:hypothetical protein
MFQLLRMVISDWCVTEADFHHAPITNHYEQLTTHNEQRSDWSHYAAYCRR